MAQTRSTTTTVTDPLRILKADHREVEQLLEKLADTDEGDERRQLIDEVRTKLTLHMELEEQMVYPLVVERVGAEDEEEAEIEHGLAREGLAKLDELADKPGFGAAVEMLKAGIKHHVEEEEKELMPSLKDTMEREEWKALGEQLLQAKEAAGQPAPTTTTRRSSKRKKAA